MESKELMRECLLTDGQKKYARGVFKQVELRPLCVENKISYQVVMNVLRGTSNNIEAFAAALKAAENAVAKKKELLKGIPSA